MSEYYINVIVVEDEKRIAKNIAKHIEQSNPHFKVTNIFSNGSDAWDYICTQPIQVVITDISMPVMDGIELVKRIHESKKSYSVLSLPDTPILVMHNLHSDTG